MGWFNSLFGSGGPIQGALHSLGNAGNSFMDFFSGGQQHPQMPAGLGYSPNYIHGQGNSAMGNFNPNMTGMGLGIMGLGQMMNRPVHMPNPYGDSSVQSLMNWQNQPNHPLDPNVAQGIQGTLNIQNEQQLRNLRDVYKNLRPGTDYTTDTSYQRDLANLNRSMAEQGANAMSQAQLASNQQQLGNLGNLAQLGVGQQMGGAALQAARRQQQNQMMGNIGSMFLQRGLGMPSFMGMFNPNY